MRRGIFLSFSVLLLLPACSFHLSDITSSGYSFDRNGETASRRLEGALAAGTEPLVVENRSGKVEIGAEEDGLGWVSVK